mmetsp:Transcript_60486/g.139509  ORF Transcript_60486/g.139509 Transcript_60486/m.139509 type:complete len:346 (+) Transcript_60486:254-1291(+)
MSRGVRPPPLRRPKSSTKQMAMSELWNKMRPGSDLAELEAAVEWCRNEGVDEGFLEAGMQRVRHRRTLLRMAELGIDLETKPRIVGYAASVVALGPMVLCAAMLGDHVDVVVKHPKGQPLADVLFRCATFIDADSTQFEDTRDVLTFIGKNYAGRAYGGLGLSGAVGHDPDIRQHILDAVDAFMPLLEPGHGCVSILLAQALNLPGVFPGATKEAIGRCSEYDLPQKIKEAKELAFEKSREEVTAALDIYANRFFDTLGGPFIAGALPGLADFQVCAVLSALRNRVVYRNARFEPAQRYSELMAAFETVYPASRRYFFGEDQGDTFMDIAKEITLKQVASETQAR